MPGGRPSAGRRGASVLGHTPFRVLRALQRAATSFPGAWRPGAAVLTRLLSALSLHSSRPALHFGTHSPRLHAALVRATGHRARWLLSTAATRKRHVSRAARLGRTSAHAAWPSGRAAASSSDAPLLSTRHQVFCDACDGTVHAVGSVAHARFALECALPAPAVQGASLFASSLGTQPASRVRVTPFATCACYHRCPSHRAEHVGRRALRIIGTN